MIKRKTLLKIDYKIIILFMKRSLNLIERDVSIYTYSTF